MWLTGFDAPVAAHAVRRQADARPRPAAGHRARQPRLRGQARRARRRLHRHRRGPAQRRCRPTTTATSTTSRSSRSSWRSRACRRSWRSSRDMLHPRRLPHGLDATGRRRGERSCFADAHNHLVNDETITKTFLDEQAALAKWYALVRTEPRGDRRSRRRSGSSARSPARSASTRRRRAGQPEAEQAVKQFFSDGLAAGEVVDVFGLADKDRPEISVLSDEFLDNIGSATDAPEPAAQAAAEAARRRDQAGGCAPTARRPRSSPRRWSDCSRSTRTVSSRAPRSSRSSSSSPRSIRDARHRHEQLGLTAEEAAFYDALAGSAPSDVKADPSSPGSPTRSSTALRKSDGLRVDWTEHPHQPGGRSASIIKRVLRKHAATSRPPRSRMAAAEATWRRWTTSPRSSTSRPRSLYRYWPDVDSDQLFDDSHDYQ